MSEPEITPAIIQHLQDSAELAERETDSHVAFHVRSNLPLPSSLCTRCNGETDDTRTVDEAAFDHDEEMFGPQDADLEVLEECGHPATALNEVYQCSLCLAGDPPPAWEDDDEFGFPDYTPARPVTDVHLPGDEPEHPMGIEPYDRERENRHGLHH